MRMFYKIKHAKRTFLPFLSQIQMAKTLHFGDEARKNIFSGIETVANAVKVTMGPKGRNVILERTYGGPIVTNDGVTVAKEIELEDKSENI